MFYAARTLGNPNIPRRAPGAAMQDHSLELVSSGITAAGMCAKNTQMNAH